MELTRNVEQGEDIAAGERRNISAEAKNTADASEALFIPIGKNDLAIFHQHFAKDYPEPMFMDIYEPLVFPSVLEFEGYFEQYDRLWRMGPLLAPLAYFSLHDVQTEQRLANIDFTYFSAYPAVGSAAAAAFWEFVSYSAAKEGFSRLQSFVLAGSKKIRLLESFGFRKEGSLREHVFHNGQYHDVIVHAWMEQHRGG